MLKREAPASAGRLTKRATFAEPVEAEDADGQIVQTYDARFTEWVHVRWLRGSEAVMQARMASRSPAVVTFRNSERARTVTSEWQVTVDGRIFQAKEDPRESEDRAFQEMLVERIG
ncbi:phage head closure protein [Paracoccus sp. NGMCC 1.201697]|uniref:Phage head closure protein n=1 Tax=Paracoccus broussonetiae subsp. drimophilus TaxID=3373869 RepID=A0ABW7LGX4_9RHOB